MKSDDRNKIHFKLGRLLEFEVCGKDAIDAGKPYMFFGALCLTLLLALLYSAQSVGLTSLTSVLAR